MPAYSPHPYQKHAIKFIVERGSAGLFLDPGLGKTSITYAAFKVLRRAKRAERMLVVAPLRPATSTWPREAQKWDDFRGLNVHVLHGDHKQLLLEQPHDVTVINPEGLKWLLGFTDAKGKFWPGAAQKSKVWWDMLVVDESTKFKHATTARFRLLKPHLHKFQRRVILTGSPAPNGLIDLFGQVYILDLGNALGNVITQYRNNYFDQTGWGGYEWIPREDAPERIYKKLKPLVLRMSATDYLDLPPLMFNPIEVELDDQSKVTYTQMEKLLVAQIDEGLVTAANVGVATQKCRQIANGGIYLDPIVDEETGITGPRKWKNLHNIKTEVAVDLVEELGGKPCLIAYEFQHDLDRLQTVFPDAPHLGGGVTAKRSREVEDLWNAGNLPILLVQPQSVAHGLNLQSGGSALIRHSIGWNLEDQEQLIRRLWRQGQKERVVVHDIVMKGTVDEDVIRTLEKKDRVQQDLLRALAERLLKKPRRP